MESHRDIMQGVTDTQAAYTSHVLSEGKFDAVVHHSKHPDKKVDPQLKHWIKTKKYQLMDLPGLGIKFWSFRITAKTRQHYHYLQMYSLWDYLTIICQCMFVPKYTLNSFSVYQLRR